MYILYGNYISGHTKTVLVCAAEMGLLDSKGDRPDHARRALCVMAEAKPLADFKVEKTDFSASSNDAWKEDHQPFGQIPYLRDTEADFEVFEARAIAKYLALKTKSKLYPQASDDIIAWKNFEQASSFEMADFDWSAIMYTWHTYVGPMFMGLKPSQDVVKCLKEAVEERLPGYEKILAKQKFLAGDELTLVDLFHLAHGTLLVESKGIPSFNDGTYPNIKRWWDSLTALDSWKRVLEDAAKN